MLYLARFYIKGTGMIKKTVLVCTAAATLFMTGCSSYPDSANGVAQAVCGAFKAGDLDDAKTYMSVSALKQTADSESVISKFFALPEFKEKAAKLNCIKPTKMRVLDKDHRRIYFGDFNVEVKKIGREWKMLN